MIPLRDLLPSHNPPRLTRALVALNVAVFIATRPDPERAINALGALAYLLTGLPPELPDGVLALPTTAASRHEVWRALTHMFVHADIWHLLGNMWFLWVFGDNVEDRLGPRRYALLYALAGLAALASQVAAAPASCLPMVGASGAVAGTLGAYLWLYPQARVLTLVPFGFIPVLITLPAAVFLWLWIGIQSLSALFAAGGGVAWWAHIGGFCLGLLLVKPLAGRPQQLRHPPRADASNSS